MPEVSPHVDEFHGHFQFVCDAGEVRTVHSFCFPVGLLGDEKSCRVLVGLAFLEVVNPSVGCRHVVVMCGMSKFMPEGGACVVERDPYLQDDDSRFRIPAATFLAWQVAFDYRDAVSACQVFGFFQLRVPIVVIFRKALGTGVCGVSPPTGEAATDSTHTESTTSGKHNDHGLNRCLVPSPPP